MTEMTVLAGKLRYLPEEGVWYVHCKHCEVEKRLNTRNEEEAYTRLHEWRLSMPRRKYQQRNWSCPRCAEWWQDTTPTATDTAEAAGQPAAKRTILLPNLRQEVEQLKVEVVQLKAAHVDEIRKLRQEIDRLRAEATAVPDND